MAALVVASGIVQAAEKVGDPSLEAVQAALKQGAELERAENCEGAWLKYKEAEGQLGSVVDKAQAAQLEAIAANKLDKLEACFKACQPSDRQKEMLDKARGFATSGEARRATQVVKRMLVGKSEKCRFWSEARVFLRSLPKQADEQDQEKVDPCEVTAEVRAALDQAKADLARNQEALGAFEAQKKRLAGKLPDVIGLLHELDATRLAVFELREEFLDCESVYKPLVADAAELKDAYGRAEELVFTTYQGQVAGLSAKIHKFQKELADKDKKLKEGADELTRLKKELEDLSAFNEEIYSDVFELAGSESLSFSSKVEGRRTDLPAEEIQALMADQTRTLKALQARYPEYFADGVNLEGLKKKKFVLEKMGEILEKFGKKGGDQKLGYARAVAEVQATIHMMDTTIAANSGHSPATAAVPDDAGVNPRMLVVLGALVVGGLLLLGLALVRRKRMQGER